MSVTLVSGSFISYPHLVLGQHDRPLLFAQDAPVPWLGGCQDLTACSQLGFHTGQIIASPFSWKTTVFSPLNVKVRDREKLFNWAQSLTNLEGSKASYQIVKSRADLGWKPVLLERWSWWSEHVHAEKVRSLDGGWSVVDLTSFSTLIIRKHFPLTMPYAFGPPPTPILPHPGSGKLQLQPSYLMTPGKTSVSILEPEVVVGSLCVLLVWPPRGGERKTLCQWSSM